MTKRIPTFDYLKGLTILLVVWMHVMQYFGHESFNNDLLSFVYSFHMPVFMIVSGYFFLKKYEGSEIITNIIHGGKRLILPNVFWGALIGTIFFDLHDVNDFLKLPLSCWFLSTLFACQVIFLLTSRLRTPLWSNVIIISLLVLFVPCGEYLKFMIPFFGIGLMFAKYRSLSYRIDNWRIIILSLILSLIEVFLWRPIFTIYETQCPNFHTILYSNVWLAYFMRLVVGTGMTYLLFQILSKFDKYLPLFLKKGVSILSFNSLGIYVIHYCLFSHLAKNLGYHLNGEINIDILSLMFASLTVALISILEKYIRKSKILALIALGEQNKIVK